MRGKRGMYWAKEEDSDSMDWIMILAALLLRQSVHPHSSSILDIAASHKC
jgi:hypothetical protein